MSVEPKYKSNAFIERIFILRGAKVLEGLNALERHYTACGFQTTRCSIEFMRGLLGINVYTWAQDSVTKEDLDSECSKCKYRVLGAMNLGFCESVEFETNNEGERT